MYSTRSDASAHLRFPTSLRTWTEGGRTFYEFKRTYEARRWRRLANATLVTEEKQLEERILEDGIFAASPDDRVAYLDLLRRQVRSGVATRVA